MYFLELQVIFFLFFQKFLRYYRMKHVWATDTCYLFSAHSPGIKNSCGGVTVAVPHVSSKAALSLSSSATQSKET